MAGKLDPLVATSIGEAVRAVEGCSCAELVVEVRDRSGSYAHADARFGAVMAFAVLLFALFSPWAFAPIWIPLDVIIGYAIGIAISRGSQTVRRLMTTRADRERKVHTAAAAAFIDRGVAKTERATGMLVYLSQLERRIEVIADRGILDAVPVLEWNQIIAAARARLATQETLSEFLRLLQPLLERYAPARAGDRDELSNEVRFAAE